MYTRKTCAISNISTQDLKVAKMIFTLPLRFLVFKKNLQDTQLEGEMFCQARHEDRSALPRLSQPHP